MYSQNNEEEIILKYFGDYKGFLLDIGANDGITLSNSLKLIMLGWKADLVEPSPVVFEKLVKLHTGNLNVRCFNIAISNQTGKATLHESGTHLNNGDYALLSTLKSEEKRRWKKETFKEITVQCETIESFCAIELYDFISIDAEGMDYEILKQMNLSKTKMLIVEFNQKDKQKYIDYCIPFGLKLLSENHENLIFTR